jgi:hypothetical protein
MCAGLGSLLWASLIQFLRGAWALKGVMLGSHEDSVEAGCAVGAESTAPIARNTVKESTARRRLSSIFILVVLL